MPKPIIVTERDNIVKPPFQRRSPSNFAGVPNRKRATSKSGLITEIIETELGGTKAEPLSTIYSTNNKVFVPGHIYNDTQAQLYGKVAPVLDPYIHEEELKLLLGNNFSENDLPFEIGGKTLEKIMNMQNPARSHIRGFGWESGDTYSTLTFVDLMIAFNMALFQQVENTIYTSNRAKNKKQELAPVDIDERDNGTAEARVNMVTRSGTNANLDHHVLKEVHLISIPYDLDNLGGTKEAAKASGQIKNQGYRSKALLQHYDLLGFRQGKIFVENRENSYIMDPTTVAAIYTMQHDQFENGNTTPMNYSMFSHPTPQFYQVFLALYHNCWQRDGINGIHKQPTLGTVNHLLSIAAYEMNNKGIAPFVSHEDRLENGILTDNYLNYRPEVKK